jgi:hypothetical protein
MKKLSMILAALALASTSSYAGSASDAFNVTLNLTATCSVSTAATDMTFNYTAFAAGSSQNTSTAFTCSRGLTPKFRFDQTGADQTGAALGVDTGTAISGEGVIAGIRYTLAGSSSKTGNGSNATAGAGGVGGTNGSADVYTVNIVATIPDNQAGDGSGAAAGTQTRTLFIEY